MPKLSIIIPCYFNEQNIPVTVEELKKNEKLFPSEVSFEYVMVDDGSRDGTWNALEKFKASYPEQVKIIKLAGNVGSYNAIMAGMAYATGEMNVVIAADLQDPPELMVKMYEYWQKGFKLILANRQDRKDSFGQKTFSNIYHYLIRKLAIPSIPPGGFDYVMFDQQLRKEVVKMKEKNTNSLYLLVWMGYEYVNIPYIRKKREIGKSRWTLKKKIKLFVDSFVSFSYFPLRFISVSGLIMGVIAFIYAMYILYARITGHIAVEGWSTLMLVVLFVSSFQMVSLGIVGEYLWRSLDAARQRPAYVVEESK